MKKQKKNLLPKILICCPVLKLKGGVASYYKKLKKYLTGPNIDFFEIGGHGKRGINILFSLIEEPFLFLKRIVSFSPDVIILNPSLKSHAITRNMFFLIFSKMLRRRVIVFWRGFNLDIAKKIKNNFLLLKIFVFVFNMADITIVLASEFRKTLKEMGITHLIITTTTVIDNDSFNVFKQEEKDVKKCRLVFMSRLEREKGIYETIEAFFILNNRYNNIELHILGDGPAQDYVKRVSLNNKNIKFYGYIDGEEKYKILKNCDIFIFPSYTEGMPNAVLEAMACGLVVVATPVGGLKDFFVPGEHGFFVQKYSSKQIAQLVEKFIENRELIEKIAQNNIIYARKNFFPRKRARFLLEICSAVFNNQMETLKKDWFDDNK